MSVMDDLEGIIFEGLKLEERWILMSIDTVNNNQTAVVGSAANVETMDKLLREFERSRVSNRFQYIIYRGLVRAKS